MAFDLTALENYTKQNADKLVTRSLFGAKTQMVIQKAGNIMTGVTSSETINVLETDAVFQTGGSCGFNGSGTTTMTQRAVTVGAIKVHEALCPKELKKKYTQLAMKAGSNPEDIPFEEEYTSLKAGKIAEGMEVGIWQGDKTSGNPQLNKFDGYIKLIDDSGVAINGNPTGITTGTGITAGNALAIVRGIKNALPAPVKNKKDVRVWCPADLFDLLVDAYVDAKYFIYGSDLIRVEEREFTIPGTNYVVTAVDGLNGTNRLFAMRDSNMYLGTDLLNEDEKWELFYAKEAMQVRFVAEWVTGVNVAFPNEIVSFKLV